MEGLTFHYSDAYDVLGADSELFILTDVLKRQGRILSSHADFVPLAEFRALIAAPSAVPQPSSADDTPIALVGAPVWSDHPWLKDFWKPHATDEDLPMYETEKPDQEHDECLDDVFDREEVVHALGEKRLELVEFLGKTDADSFFSTNYRGGAWTKLNHGVDYDSIRVEAKRIALQFCRKFRLPGSATFSIALYSEPLAVSLSQCWVHKHYFLLSQWVANGT